MKLNWNFLGGGGGGGGPCKTKTLLRGEYGYFLELYNSDLTKLSFIITMFLTADTGVQRLSTRISLHSCTVHGYQRSARGRGCVIQKAIPGG